MTTQTRISDISDSLRAVEQEIYAAQHRRESLKKQLHNLMLQDVLEKDAAWVAPNDWMRLFDQKTSYKEWVNAVGLAGISAGSEWVDNGERAVKITLYEELPNRIDFLTSFIEAIMPFIVPWKDGKKYIGINTQDGSSLRLVVDEQGSISLKSNRGCYNAEFDGNYPSIDGALKHALNKCFACISFFRYDSD